MSTSTTGLVSLFGLDPASYKAHPVHTGDRPYTETNCYTDILIEMLHARGDEPLAGMAATVRTDFEGDQWTFFKPFPSDLEQLFGVDVHEMQPYRPLPQQIEEQIRAGRTLIVELDSFYLPDTASTAYRTEHVKSSAVMEAIDQSAERLVYFHNAGLYELEGEDYRGVFRLGREFSDDVLPPYTEIVRFDGGPRLEGDELRDAALSQLRYHLPRRPRRNPFDAFGEQLGGALPELLAGDSAAYHDYAFATVRMVGSAFAVCAAHIEWALGEKGAPAAQRLDDIVSGCKTLSFKLARRREFDPEPAVTALGAAWDEAFTRLDETVGG